LTESVTTGCADRVQGSITEKKNRNEIANGKELEMNNPSAFPIFIPTNPYEINEGMTLRDYFAAATISPMLVQAYGSTPELLASNAYRIADAMLAERDKQKGSFV
jgi:hypothetical protein